MPIRINLLSEAQAAEELRRKDPVKRAVLASALLVAGMLCWGSTLQFKIITSKSGLKDLDASAQPGSQVNKFKEAIANVPYFQSNLQKTNGVLLTSLSAPQNGPLGRSPYVMLTLQCYFPEKVR